MDYRQDVSGSTCNIVMSGKFTFSDHEKFREIIDNIKKGIAKSFIFDFREVDFLDSAALGMLLIAREESEKNSSTIILRNIDKVSRMLKVAKFDALFNMQ